MKVYSLIALCFGVVVLLLNVKEGEGQSNCFCTYDYSPVCGSNDKTYSSSCQLNCAKKQNPSLRLQYSGSCRSSGSSHRPGHTGAIRPWTSGIGSQHRYGSSTGQRSHGFIGSSSSSGSRGYGSGSRGGGSRGGGGGGGRGRG